MKTLPDAPSVDHLRQQAKDMLPQLRALRPGTTLSDAQAAVAQRYGFRTWPDLKAEVERLRASVRTAEESVTAAIAAAFDLGTPDGPMVAAEREWAGQAWALTTDRGRWSARQLFRWWDGSEVEAEVLMAEAAAGAGIVTRRPVRTPAGAVIDTVDGAQWRVFEALDAGPEPSMPADPRHAAAAGRILGRVHRLGLPAARPVTPWLTCVRPASTWWALHEACASRGAPWADRLAEVIPVIVAMGAIAEPVDAAGPVVFSACHVAPNAFRVIGPDDLAVDGWDHAGSIPSRWELGSMLDGWSGGVPGEVNGPAVRALVAGYAEEAAVPGPLDLGIFSASLGATASWLISRIRIAINPNEDAESRDLAARSVPWLLERPPSRAHFEAVLAAVGRH